MINKMRSLGRPVRLIIVGIILSGLSSHLTADEQINGDIMVTRVGEQLSDPGLLAAIVECQGYLFTMSDEAQPEKDSAEALLQWVLSAKVSRGPIAGRLTLSSNYLFVFYQDVIPWGLCLSFCYYRNEDNLLVPVLNLKLAARHRELGLAAYIGGANSDVMQAINEYTSPRCANFATKILSFFYGDPILQNATDDEPLPRYYDEGCYILLDESEQEAIEKLAPMISHALDFAGYGIRGHVLLK